MKYAANWERSAERYTAWWQGEAIDRCCLSVTAPKKILPDLPQYTNQEVLAHWTDPDWLLEQWVPSFENTYFAGDAFPNLWLNLGPSGHAGYCRGSRYTFMRSVGLNCTTWYDPIIEDWSTDMPVFDEQGLLYQKTLLLARELSRRANGDFIVSMPDTSGNWDALAELRGSSDLLIDMLEEPDALQRACDILQDIWEKAVTDVSGILRSNGQKGGSIGWMQVWAPGLTAQLQCDLSVMISTEAFEQFAMPQLRRQCDFLEYPIYHLDGHEQIRHLDLLLSLSKLRAIQWTPVDGQPSPLTYMSSLQKIQRAGKSLYLMLKPEEVAPALEMLSPRGLNISVSTATPEEADALVALAERSFHG